MARKVSIIALTAFVILAIVALYHNISPYLTPSDLIQMGQVKNVQVVGKVVSADGEVFTLSDGKNSITVFYNAKIQQLSDEVVVVGDWDGKVLHAVKIYQKCHTEYKGG